MFHNMRLIFKDRLKRTPSLGCGQLELTQYCPHSREATVVAGSHSMAVNVARLTPLRPTVKGEIIVPLLGHWGDSALGSSASLTEM